MARVAPAQESPRPEPSAPSPPPYTEPGPECKLLIWCYYS